MDEDQCTECDDTNPRCTECDRCVTCNGHARFCSTGDEEEKIQDKHDTEENSRRKR